MSLKEWIILIFIVLGIWFILNQPIIDVEIRLPMAAIEMGCQDFFESQKFHLPIITFFR